MSEYNTKSISEGALPVFPEGVDEKEQSRRLSSYLQSLRDRLRWALQQNQEAISSSMKLLKEVGDISGVLLTKSGSQIPATKIRRLIMGFEAVSGSNISQHSTVPEIPLSNDLTGTRALLVEFETLNESQILRESIVSFKSAAESLEKVLTVLEKPKNQASQLSTKPQASQHSTRRNLREKIEAFNKGEKLGDNCRHFTNCFRTSPSTDEMQNAFEGNNASNNASKTNSGYEGDVDTEAELADKSSNDSGLRPKK
ncbi:uncharacterized protein LOC110191106 [Drosophila serrata]|uniref:uncharacterized protein LOC110191106 n=1 Tax=Drosophila serrata TaxID=7274 RepID=UPI000A1D098B|nr:uncharacterized protein LOC110191106 [Drosophila serrata]